MRRSKSSSYLSNTWGMGEPRFPAEKAVAFSEGFHKSGAAITCDVPVRKNRTIGPAFAEQLSAIGKQLAK